jgi:subtilisin family serine protease
VAGKKKIGRGVRRAGRVRPIASDRRELIVIASSGAATGRVRATARGRRGRSLEAVLSRAAARLKPLFGVSPERLQVERDRLRAAAAAPRLETFYKVEAPDERLDELAAQLRAHPSVMAAYVKPQTELPVVLNRMTASAAAAPAMTPSFTDRQGYLGPAPGGIDAWFAWTQQGGRGEGVRIIDIEGGWRFSHEDLAQNQGGLAGGTMIDQIDWRTHGTAVLGAIGGDENPFGITGIVPAANLKAVSHGDIGSAAAIRLAASMLQPGDLLLLEMHRPGPRHNFEIRSDQLGYIAVEWWPDDFEAIRFAVARGVVVVEAAGNGAESLDDRLYDTPAAGFPATWVNPFRRATDSGAILVAAGAPPPGTHGANYGPDRSRLDFSNFGDCVDAQGWGREVTTTGYGDLQGGQNEDFWYTDRFSGTSSASPIVTGALAAVQGVRLAAGLSPLTPATARQLLRATGSSQQIGTFGMGRIGNRPDLRQMLASIADAGDVTEVNSPVVDIVSYDPAVRPGTPWRATVEDAANPGNRVIVEFVNDSFHVTWSNPAGEDRSTQTRRIDLG